MKDLKIFRFENLVDSKPVYFLFCAYIQRNLSESVVAEKGEGRVVILTENNKPYLE